MEGAVPTSSQPLADGLAARRRLYLALSLFLIGLGVGAAWDRAWHVHNTFESFYSPPHLFIYTLAGLSMAVVGSIVFTPRLRNAFGEGIKLPLAPFPVPGPLLLLCGALGVIAIAGLLDDAWHSAFGLDETIWSVPHAMLGWGYFLTIIGFASCRIALAPYKLISGFGLFSFGFLILGAALSVVLGPLGNNNTPESVYAVSRFGVLPQSASAQHTFRIYLDWNLTRTNPAMPILASLAAGVGLSLMRKFTLRRDLFLCVALVSSILTMMNDRAVAVGLNLTESPSHWLPIPIFPAAILFIFAAQKGIPEQRAWIITGIVFGFMCLLIWGSGVVWGLATLASGPAMAVGAACGSFVYSVMLRPTQRTLSWFVPVVGFGMPLLSGAVDLALRFSTP